MIRHMMAKSDPRFFYSISMTTRERREGEMHGRDYFFVTKDEFEEHIRGGKLVEYEKVHDCYYGTPRDFLLEGLQNGLIVFLDIDVNGALTVKRMFGEKSLLIFLKPVNKQVLIDRLLKRGSETEEEIKKRMQRVEKELQKSSTFDHVVINDHLPDTVAKVEKLVLSKYLSNRDL